MFVWRVLFLFWVLVRGSFKHGSLIPHVSAVLTPLKRGNGTGSGLQTPVRPNEAGVTRFAKRGALADRAAAAVISHVEHHDLGNEEHRAVAWSKSAKIL